MKHRAVSHGLGVVVVAALFAFAEGALGQSVDAEIGYHQGLAALGRGDKEAARKLFTAACLADGGSADACLEWARLAFELPKDAPGKDRDLKRALGSAVMLAPDDPVARYELAMLLLEKNDYTWAIEHLTAALETAEGSDAALVRYYLGYAHLENGDAAKADEHLARAEGHLSNELAERCRYFRALAAQGLGREDEARQLLRESARSSDAEISTAARERLLSNTAFPRAQGVHGQVSASLGVNTHPTAAVFDDPGAAGAPVLQSVLRGDLVYNAGNDTHGFLGAFTLYRDQSFTEIGPRTDGARDGEFYVANRSEPSDSDLTHIQAQAGYAWRGFGRRLEHEIRLGLDLSLQFLDREVAFRGVLPTDPESGDACAVGVYEASDDAFALYAYSVGERIWWSFAESKASAWSVQLKHEIRPNEFEADRSANRFRLRVQNTSNFLNGALQLKTYAGGYYDRTYADARVVKFDKLAAEASAELKWNTPLEHIALMLGSKLLYHSYLNSKGNEANSFRPAYVTNDQFTIAENEAFERDYYDLARRDFEWELSAEIQVDLWKRGLFVVKYLHHQRISNIDDAPRPAIPSDGCGDAPYQRVPLQKRGYEQDIAAVELRQIF